MAGGDLWKEAQHNDLFTGSMDDEPHRRNPNRRGETRDNARMDQGHRRLTLAPATNAAEPVAHTLYNRPGS